MLARISRGTAQALGLSFTRGKSPRHIHDSVSVTQDAEEVIIDLDVLLLPWWRYASECKRTIAPVYHTLQNLLSDDVECITRLLFSLEATDEDEEYDYELSGEDHNAPCLMNLGPGGPFPYRERPPHRQQSECHPNTPVVIPSSHTSIPTIIITPCETQPRETSVLVPLQDSAFSSRLTVPRHSRVNHAFPPMASNAPSLYMLPELNWRWRNGHWEALLPGLDDQTQKGMFSRAISRKKSSGRCRPPSK
ncbi:hypothetical protein GYMLUDRAFT_32528 [Collybiopsis luxurians FD-317 M1]|nr:hypothetical protein GYMLUDRAFT_32528 [Collybiopsis luxurians FD-317 M1]